MHCHQGLIDFDDNALQLIAHAATMNPSIMGKVLCEYFESRRRQPITNPSALIISSLRKEFGRETSRRMMNPGYGDAEIAGWLRGQPSSSSIDAEIAGWFRGQPAGAADWFTGQSMDTAVPPSAGDWFREQPNDNSTGSEIAGRMVQRAACGCW